MLNVSPLMPHITRNITVLARAHNVTVLARAHNTCFITVLRHLAARL